MDAKITPTKSGKIEYILDGNGPVILVLHGQSQDCHAASDYDAFIKAGFTILTPSRPGYGKTLSVVGVSAEKAADSIVDLIDHLKILKTNVLAVSGGGPTAIFLAANHPDRVRKLVLVSALCKPWEDNARYKTVKQFYGNTYPIMWGLLRFFSMVFPKTTAKTTISIFSTHDPNDFMRHISRQEIKTLLRLYRNRAYRKGPLIDLKSQPDASILNRIKAPTLVVHSKEDKSVTFENAEYSTHNIKSSELFVSPTWSHFPWFGPHSEDQLDRVISFLKS
jgi:pimeloyl-ACP methyl ester carboxylesterase